jgi:hypothetical protein
MLDIKKGDPKGSPQVSYQLFLLLDDVGDEEATIEHI